jgi:pullulanase
MSLHEVQNAAFAAHGKMIFFHLTLWLFTISNFMATEIMGQEKPQAEINALNEIKITFPDEVGKVKLSQFKIEPEIKLLQLRTEKNTVFVKTEPINLSCDYFLIWQESRIEIQPGAVLDYFTSDKVLGYECNDDRTIFRVFAPRASQVALILFQKADDHIGKEFNMIQDMDGVWECLLPGQYFGQYYNYRIHGPSSPTELFDPDNLVCDPYSKAVVTTNEYLHRGKTLILDHSVFDWEGDNWLRHKMEDLVIYECHVRDMTAHPSSGVDPHLAGSYRGLLQPGITGGLEYIKTLGVNAVEFLPVQEFGNIEWPFKTTVKEGMNYWNPYSRNHWGYMTSYFFAPESYYAGGNTMEPDRLCGSDGRQVDEFKETVKAFHKAGIAVIMDVVFNHVSQYDHNCFKLIDKKYYFRLDADQSFLTTSGCGNDFKTERPMARRFVLDCVKYWMTEYHVDGFRFDLATMIDWETVDRIFKETRKINPDVILIAEAWGGGKYDPDGFSEHGWAAWNDHIRNGVKGQNPFNGQGFIFGKWWDKNDLQTIKRYVQGTLVRDGGLYVDKAHSVNYLESHDDNTFGDFIRISLDPAKGHGRIASLEENALAFGRHLKIHKLGILILFTSQGPVMIHEGQEYSRSKVIAPSTAPDTLVGHIDHNSYNKDNETNWLNFQQAAQNRDLVDYYKGLIHLRRTHPAFRLAGSGHITFLENSNPFALGYLIAGKKCGDESDFLVLVNANAQLPASFQLPAGQWQVVADGDKAGTAPLYEKSGQVELPPTCGMVLRMQ